MINLEWTITGKSSNKTAGLASPASVCHRAEIWIRFAHPSVSRQHACLQADAAGVKIKILSPTAVVSINGTQNVPQFSEGALSVGIFLMPGHVKAGGRIVVVPDGTTLDAVCFNCSREISSQEAEFFVPLS